MIGRALARVARALGRRRSAAAPPLPEQAAPIATRLGEAAAGGHGALDAAVLANAPELFSFHRQQAATMARHMADVARAEGRPLRYCPSCGEVPAPDPALVAEGAEPSCPCCGLPTVPESP